jgi:2-oxoglutarate ferredoxin oxidoreductase subunit gamma
MREEVFISGLGGQGIVLAGQLLAQAGMDAGLEVSWYPSYSPEVRGGEATCTVILADGLVGSPVSGRPRTALLLDPRSVANYAGTCAPGGTLIINTGLGEEPVERDDVRVVRLDGNALAAQLGDDRILNMVMVGAYLQAARPEMLGETAEALSHVLPERHHRFIPMNLDAIRAGAEAVREQTA